MVLYNDIENAVKAKKQKLNNAHIRNLRIMNVLNALVMILLIIIDGALIWKGIYTGMPLFVMITLPIFLVAQIVELFFFMFTRFSRASMITKVSIMTINILPIISYIAYINVGNNIYIGALIVRIICLIALGMLLFNTKTTNDKKVFAVKGIPLAVAAIIAILGLLYVSTSTFNRKIIYKYDYNYNGYMVKDVLNGQGDIVLDDNCVGIYDDALENAKGNLTLPKNVKYISKNAFNKSDLESLTIYSSDIELMDALDNSNIERIYLKNDDTNIDIKNIDNDIRFVTDRKVVDSYREKYRKYDYMFIPKVNDDEYYVCFNGTTLPVYIYNEEKTINEPTADSLQKEIDGRSILYDGYYVKGEEISFPFNTKTSKEINCKYSFVYKINYDFSLVDEKDYDLPKSYYDKLGEIKLPELDVDGYVFKGWYDVDEYGNYTKQYTKLDSNLNNDINLKAKFLRKFNITLAPILDNVELNSDEVVTFTEEDLVNLPTPEKEGFIFDDWYYDEGYNVKVSKIESDMTIYAKWDIETPTINVSEGISKDFDNKEEEINVSALSNVEGVTISYSWLNSNEDVVSNNDTLVLKNASDSDLYVAKITLNYNDLVISNYLSDEVEVIINKLNYDMSSLSFVDKEYTYDGTEHYPTLEGELPIGIDGIQITYVREDGAVNVSTKESICRFNTLSENYNVPEPLKANVTITKREVSVIWDGNLVSEYTGNLITPTCSLSNVLTKDKDLIEAVVEGSANGIGEHEAHVSSLRNKTDVNIVNNYLLIGNTTTTFIIERSKVTLNITVEDVEAIYDGSVHHPNIIDLPSDVEAHFSADPTNVGKYTVTITFSYKDQSTEQITDTYTKIVTITPKEINVSWSANEFIYEEDKLQRPTPTITNSISGDDVTLDYEKPASENAGTYRINYLGILGSHNNNYKLPTDSYFEYVIKPKSISVGSVSFDDQVYIYNGKNQYPQISSSTLPANVTVSYSGYGKNAGNYTVVATFATSSSNYDILDSERTKEATVEIKQINAQISWGRTTFIFDNQQHKPEAIVTNLLPGDTCNVFVTGSQVSAGSGYEAEIEEWDNKNYYIDLEDESVCKITFSIEGSSFDFTFSYENKTFTYDGQYHLPEVVIEDGMPEWLTIRYTNSQGQTTNGIKDAGSLAVTATFIASDSHNVPDPITAVVTIEAIEAQISFILENNIYNGTRIVPTAMVANLAQGDTSPAVELNSIGYINVGTYEIKAIDIIDNPNYKISDEISYTYRIEKATYDLSGWTFDPIEVEYDGLSHRPSVIKDAEIVGFDGIPVSIEYNGEQKSVGSSLVTASFKGSDNYNLIPSQSARVTVRPKEVTLKWTNTSLEYTGQILKPNCEILGLASSDICDVTVIATGVNVGTYKATASYLSNENYVLPQDASTSYEITPKTLILNITVEPNNKIYDGEVLYPIISGKVPEEVTISYENLTNNVGVTTVIVKFEVSSNYNPIPQRTCDVEILQREISITWTNTEVVYTGVLKTPDYKLNNIITGDDCQIEVQGAGINVGTYTVYAVGLNNPNYKLDQSSKVEYTIIPADYDMSGIRFNNVVKEYNGLSQHPYIQGTLPQGVTVSYTGGAKEVAEGIVTCEAIFETKDSNYNKPASMKATIQITAKKLDVIWNQTRFNYDMDKHYPQASLSGLITGDSCEITGLSQYGIDAGSYECYVIGVNNANYYVDQNDICTFVIDKINYDMSSITFKDQTFTYDGTVHAPTISGSLQTIVGLDGTSPEVDTYTGTVKNVSDGKVLRTVTFKTISQNYNAPDDMTCYIEVTPISLNLNISLDTNSSKTASSSSWNNTYTMSLVYDGKAHNVNISVTDADKTKIAAGDSVTFSINDTFKYVGSQTLNITSSDENYAPMYPILNVTINTLYIYYYYWQGLEPYFEGASTNYEGNKSEIKNIEDLSLVYYDNSTGLVYYDETPTAYGEYKKTYISKTDNVSISSNSSSQTYNISLTAQSLIELVDVYDSNDDNIISDLSELIIIENLYNNLSGQEQPQYVYNVIENSYELVPTNAKFIGFTANNTSTDPNICQVQGNIDSRATYKPTILRHTFTTGLKLESSTKITVSMGSYTSMILVFNYSQAAVKVNGTEYKSNANGYLFLDNLSGSVIITKSYSMDIFGIVLY